MVYNKTTKIFEKVQEFAKKAILNANTSKNGTISKFRGAEHFLC